MLCPINFVSLGPIPESRRSTIVAHAGPLRRAKGASERTIEEGVDPMNQFDDIGGCEES